MDAYQYFSKSSSSCGFFLYGNLELSAHLRKNRGPETRVAWRPPTWGGSWAYMKLAASPVSGSLWRSYLIHLMRPSCGMAVWRSCVTMAAANYHSISRANVKQFTMPTNRTGNAYRIFVKVDSQSHRRQAPGPSNNPTTATSQKLPEN